MREASLQQRSLHSSIKPPPPPPADSPRTVPNPSLHEKKWNVSENLMRVIDMKNVALLARGFCECSANN